MAEAAVRKAKDFERKDFEQRDLKQTDFDSDLVRRIMARPIRVRPAAPSVVVAPVAQPSPVLDEPEPDEIDHETVDTAATADVARLRAEIMVMKAVLQAERREAASLRAVITDVADPAKMSDEARAVRDRWAGLVNALLCTPR